MRVIPSSSFLTYVLVASSRGLLVSFLLPHFRYFASLGIQINDVYGMSECTGATTFSTDESHIWGSCGSAMTGMEVAILKPHPQEPGTFVSVPTVADIFNASEEEQGEICYRGRHIMMGCVEEASS